MAGVDDLSGRQSIVRMQNIRIEMPNLQPVGLETSCNLHQSVFRLHPPFAPLYVDCEASRGHVLCAHAVGCILGCEAHIPCVYVMEYVSLV